MFRREPQGVSNRGYITWSWQLETHRGSLTICRSNFTVKENATFAYLLKLNVPLCYTLQKLRPTFRESSYDIISNRTTQVSSSERRVAIHWYGCRDYVDEMKSREFTGKEERPEQDGCAESHTYLSRRSQWRW